MITTGEWKNKLWYIYYRGLPCDVLSRSVVSSSLRPHGLVTHQTPLSMGILQARILE